MLIGGFQRFSLSDFPGRVASIIFTQGCNFSCPFCHNGDLIPQHPSESEPVTTEEVLGFLRYRTSLLDGVVITGGEPTIHVDLPEFLLEIRSLGFDVKLDTNGSRPKMIAGLILKDLVDYIAMDVKAPLDKYPQLAGTEVKTGKVLESIEIIAGCGMEHEFRTTAVSPLLDKRDIMKIKTLIPPESRHILQHFRPEKALSPELRSPVPGRDDFHELSALFR